MTQDLTDREAMIWAAAFANAALSEDISIARCAQLACEVVEFTELGVGLVGVEGAMLRSMLGGGEGSCVHDECPEPVPKSCEQCNVGTGKPEREG